MPVFKSDEIKSAEPPKHVSAETDQSGGSDWWEKNSPSQAKPRLDRDVKKPVAITDEQRQYAPPIPKLPIPRLLKTQEQQKKERIERMGESPSKETLAAAIGHPEMGSAELGITAAANLDPTGVLPGTLEAVKGVKKVATAKTGREVAGGVHQVVGGVFDAATPAMAGGLVSSPGRVLKAVGVGMASQAGTEQVLQKLGLPKEYAEVAGDIVGFLTGGMVDRMSHTDRAALKEKIEPALKKKMEANDAALEQLLKVETDPAKRAELEKQAKARGIKIPEVETRREEASGALAETARVDAQFDEAERRLAEKEKSKKPAKERKSAARPVVPEEGTPENIARTQDARQRIIGKPPEQWTNSEIIAADELIAEGHTGAGGPAAPEVQNSKKKQNKTPEEVDAERQKIIGKPRYQWTQSDIEAADQLREEGHIGDTRPIPQAPATPKPVEPPQGSLDLIGGSPVESGPIPSVVFPEESKAPSPQGELALSGESAPEESARKESKPPSPPPLSSDQVSSLPVANQVENPAPQREPIADVTPFSPGEAPEGAIRGFSGQADVPRGYDIDFDYAVVPENNLIASHNDVLDPNPEFPQELQPRKRTRVASKLQIKKIYDTLKPRKLGHNDSATTGAPVIGPDGVVESGNGRVIALRRLFSDRHSNGRAYVKWLKENARSFGIDPASLEGVKDPVLVRVRKNLPGNVSRKDFTRHANARETGGMSAVELAAQDSEILGPEVTAKFNSNSDFDSASNREFVRGFLENLSDDERDTLIKGDGTLNSAGITRIRNALFARAYGDISTLETMSESTDSNIKSVINGMLEAAPEFVKLDAAIEAGNRYPVSIAEDVGESSAKFSELKKNGGSISDFINQKNLDGSEVKPIQRDLLQMMDEFSRSGKKIGDVLKGYAQAVNAIGDPNQVGMFGPSEVPEPDAVLNAVIESIRLESAEKKAAMQRGKGQKSEEPSKVQQSEPVDKPEGIGSNPKEQEGGRKPAGEEPEGENGPDPEVAAMKRSPRESSPQLAKGGLFDQEEAKDIADSSAKDRDRLLGERLTAGFNSPISAGENAKKLKPGKKPVQHDFFSTIEDEMQDTLFLKPLEKNEIPYTKDGNFDAAKLVDTHKYRYEKPKSEGQPGRLYMDKPTGVLVEQYIAHAIGKQDFQALAAAIPGKTVLKVARTLRNTAKLGGNRATEMQKARLNDLAATLEKSYRDNPIGTVVIQAGSGHDIRSVRMQLRHEMAHIDQMQVESEQREKTKSSLFVDKSVFEHPLVKKAQKNLNERGYANNPITMSRELLSHIAGAEVQSNGLVRGIGLTMEETGEVLKEIVDSINRVNPENVEKLLKYVKPSIQESAKVGKRGTGEGRKAPPGLRDSNKVGSGGSGGS